jgi:hypothetical protein
MQNPDSRRTLALGLIGGLLGALLITSMPAVMAAVGDPIRIGNTNTGTAPTILRGDADPSLRIVNPSGDPALELRVGQGNRPLRVDSNKRIPKLNADRLDGRNANQMLRVAEDRVSLTPDDNGPAATATITAPTDGFLVMSGSIELRGSAYDEVQCALSVKAQGTTRNYGHHDVVIEDAGGDHTSNGSNVCATDAVTAVPAGTYDVSLTIFWWTNANLEGATVWVIFVPFDGEGNPPDNPTW